MGLILRSLEAVDHYFAQVKHLISYLHRKWKIFINKSCSDLAEIQESEDDFQALQLPYYESGVYLEVYGEESPTSDLRLG